MIGLDSVDHDTERLTCVINCSEIELPQVSPAQCTRSKESSAPTDVAFAIANFPDTDDGKTQVENFLEMRLLNVMCEVRYNWDQKTMTLHFDTAEDATQGRDFLSGLGASSLDVFSDICMQGQPGALELLDVIGAKRALSLLSPTKPASEAAHTPHYEEEALSKRAKVESDLNAWTPDLGSSSNAGPVHIKTESAACLPRPSTPIATTVDTPVVFATSCRPSTQM